MTKDLRLYLVFFVTLSIFLTLIFFWGVDANQFLFLHDEYLTLSLNESLGSFYTRIPRDFGSSNTTILIVTFFDRLYYLLSYSLGLSILASEKVLYFLKLILITTLPFLGFQRLVKQYGSNATGLSTLLISLWYSFNIYTLIYWHGNAFSLTLLILYALTPLVFSVFHKCVFEASTLKDRIALSILFFFMSFALYLFSVFLFFLFFYLVIYCFLGKKSVWQTAINIAKFLIIYLPFSIIPALAIWETLFYSGLQAVNSTGGETFTSLSGGLLYQLFMWFSWGIYNPWKPRNIFTFYKYFWSPWYLITPFILYFLVIKGVLEDKKNVVLLTLFSILLIMFLFVKGGQEPIGWIYSFLIQNVPGFRVFRSPDNKFGYGIVFVISLMLLITHKHVKSKLFLWLMGFVIIAQSLPLFTGTAIKGENTETSSDRAITLSGDYLGLASFTNSNARPFGYVLSLPSVDFGHFKIEGEGVHIGQELTSKLSKLPYIFINDYTGLPIETYKRLAQSLKDPQKDVFNGFPIRYYVLRSDVLFAEVPEELVMFIKTNFSLVYENEVFEVYENPDFSPLLEAQNLEYRELSPIKYLLEVKNISKDEALVFRQNFDPGWTLYRLDSQSQGACSSGIDLRSSLAVECGVESQLGSILDFDLLRRERVFGGSSTKTSESFNAWTLSLDEIREFSQSESVSVSEDGSYNLSLLLYYKPQLLYSASFLISFGYLVALILYLVFGNLVRMRR